MDQGETAGRLVWFSALLTLEDWDLLPAQGLGAASPFLGLITEFMESMLSHGKGAAFFPHVSQGVLGAHQKLSIDLTACANMWGEYWDSLICTVSTGGWPGAQGPPPWPPPAGLLSSNTQPSASQVSPSRKVMPAELGMGLCVCQQPWDSCRRGPVSRRSTHIFAHEVHPRLGPHLGGLRSQMGCLPWPESEIQSGQ